MNTTLFDPTKTNITSKHVDAFNALISGEFSNFALFSCFVNGEPAAAIVAVNFDGETYDLHPLFVSVTEKMKLTDHDGESLLTDCLPVSPLSVV